MGKGYNYEKFLNDLDFGNDNENYVAQYLTEHLDIKNYEENRSDSAQKLKEFDIEIETNSGEKFTIEVKCDRHVATAGYDSKNIFIETENPINGKATGACVSTAKYFITYFICLGEIWMIETDELLKVIDENKGNAGMRFREYCGDGNASGYTMPRDTFEKYFTVFKEEDGVVKVPIEVIQKQEEEKKARYAAARAERDRKSAELAAQRRKDFESSDVLKNLFK